MTSYLELKPIIFLIFSVAIGCVFAYNVYKRLRYLKLGKPVKRFDEVPKRIGLIFVYVLGHVQKLRKKSMIPHFFMFWGFLLLLPTIAQAVGEGLFHGFIFPILGELKPLLLIQDVIVLFVMGGAIFGFFNRLVLKPERYKGSHKFDAILILVFVFVLMFALLSMNGLYGNLNNDELASWRPISAIFALPYIGLSDGAQFILAEFFWWLHIGIALIFLAYIPSGKHFHIITSVPSVFVKNLKPRGRLSNINATGAEKIEDFTWKNMLDLYSCTECGYCQDACPAYASGGVLSPKLMIMSLRNHLEEKGAAIYNKEQFDTNMMTDGASPEALWSCYTCLACGQECSLFIEHTQDIVDMRRFLIGQGDLDAQVQEALKNFTRYGNSFGKSDRMRARWSKSLGFKIKDARKESVDLLWFVGDYASFDTRCTPTTEKLAHIFKAGGLNFGIMYDGERNSGNDVRRIGEEGLFEFLVESNIESLGACEFKHIVTSDPHTYNTLKNEYTEYGGEYSVKFYTEVLDDLIENGKLNLQKKIGKKATYHDPCYLGRYNNVYSSPRKLIKKLGVQLVEMERSKEEGFCCGAGGGRIWMEDVEGTVERPAENRVKEAVALGVDTLIVACPKDYVMFEDAIKTTNNEDKLVVKDIADFVYDSLNFDNEGAK